MEKLGLHASLGPGRILLRCLQLRVKCRTPLSNTMKLLHLTDHLRRQCCTGTLRTAIVFIGPSHKRARLITEPGNACWGYWALDLNVVRIILDVVMVSLLVLMYEKYAVNIRFHELGGLIAG